MARPIRRLGQHFLRDSRLLARIADALGAAPGDTVIEVGPGPGGLTAALAERAGRVVALEKDPALARGLAGRWPGVEVVAGDALEADWHALAGGPFLVAGNIPYNITSPLLDKALTPPRPARVVFLVQREVAGRLAAAPGTAAYGALTVGVQSVAAVERLFAVPAGAFHPPPRVESAVVRLEPLALPLVGDAEVAAFRRTVVGLFGFRRKQLLRGLRELTGWEVERAGGALIAAGVEPTLRPEALAPAEFVRLHQALVDGGWRDG
ncbi:MAG TPA: 16S rRNA (adenine(1518)-N(6)/adenine(1519)-N(6))-dimethyltransferase RsmA [Gemmatimonadales bacterium]|nr:16S rRNA (adenine(1518)-N(6)/adenine(1519)-N(6))-dimethyltransferase RsmA [Gemmatimonadales bacterium]